MSENKTPFIGLNQWDGNEYPKRVDFVNDNEKIDTALRILDETKAGAGELGDLADVITDGLTGISTELGDVGNIVTQVDTKVTDVQGKVGNPGDTSPDTLFGRISSSGGTGFGVQIYSTPGQHTFTVPVDTLKVFITACGGGGGGGVVTGTSGGGGGGGADFVLRRTVNVTPGQILNIIVGAGGERGTTPTGDGKSGSATVIDGILTLAPGGGGKNGDGDTTGGLGGNPGGVNSGAGGIGKIHQGRYPTIGGNSTMALGGGANTSFNSVNAGGGGGGSLGGGGGGASATANLPYTSGGTGGFLIMSNGVEGGVSYGGSGGRGGGGGGGGFQNSPPESNPGSMGGDGIVIIEY